MESPAGAANRAPRAVPALRMATMLEESEVGIMKSPSPSVVPKSLRNEDMARMPLMDLRKRSISTCHYKRGAIRADGRIATGLVS